jgi:Flp pilus assembly pilin Flp
MTMQTRWLRLPNGAKRLLRDERATTAIEYALIASVVSMAILVSVCSVGSTLMTNTYDRITAAFATTAPAPPPP